MNLALVQLSLWMTNEYQSNVISRSSFRLMSENNWSQNYIPQKSHIINKQGECFLEIRVLVCRYERWHRKITKFLFRTAYHCNSLSHICIPFIRCINVKIVWCNEHGKFHMSSVQHTMSNNWNVDLTKLNYCVLQNMLSFNYFI